MSKVPMMLWNDEGGFILSTEAMILWTIVVLGMTTGLVAIRNATLIELTEVANTVTTFDQSYSYPGVALVSPNRTSALVAGSNALDSPGTSGGNSTTPTWFSLGNTGSPQVIQSNYPNIVSISSP